MKTISKERYAELGTILKYFYWEYIESKSTEKNEFISAIEKAFAYSDGSINPYNSGNFNVAFSYNNSEYGAKRFLQEFNKKLSYRIVPIINKVLEHTSDIRVISLIILPYVLDKIDITTPETSHGIRLAIALTCLIIERKINAKKNKILREELDYINSFFKDYKEIENIHELIDVLDKINED